MERSVVRGGNESRGNVEKGREGLVDPPGIWKSCVNWKGGKGG